MTQPPSRSILTISGVAGLLAVVGNVLGVVGLQGQPAAYRTDGLSDWVAQIGAHPAGTALSAWGFTVGVLLLTPFAAGLRALLPRDGLVDAGSRLIALGGLMDGVATLMPFVLSQHVLPVCASVQDCLPLGRAMLGFALSMDGATNLLIGLGLVLAGLGLRAVAPKTGILGVVVGLALMPVVGQSVSQRLADWLLIAGPAWLGWVVVASVVLLGKARATRKPSDEPA